MTAIGDGAYGTIDPARRDEAQEAATPYSFIAPVTHPGDRGFFTKEDFQIDIEKHEVRCLSGQSTTKSSERRDTQISGRVITYHTYCFSQKQCEGCPLRAKCLEKETRFRTISVHEQQTRSRLYSSNSGSIHPHRA